MQSLIVQRLTPAELGEGVQAKTFRGAEVVAREAACRAVGSCPDSRNVNSAARVNSVTRVQSINLCAYWRCGIYSLNLSPQDPPSAVYEGDRAC
jgi:hypothetical protein